MPSLRSWASDHLLATALFAALSLSGLVVGSLALFAVLLLAVLGVGGPLAATLSALTLPLLVGVLLAVPLAVLSVVALGGGLLARASEASLPRPSLDNVRQWAAYAEREYPTLRRLGLADRLDRRSPEERAKDALAALKRLYVDGEIDAETFEREAGRVVGASPLDRDELLDGETALDREIADLDGESGSRDGEVRAREPERPLERDAAAE